MNHKITTRIKAITYSQESPDLNSLKVFAQTKGKEIINSSTEAHLKVAQHGASIVQPSDILMTCSYSSPVCQAL